MQLTRNKPQHEYIDGSRKYRTPWGIYPSVTSILRETANDFTLHRWRSEAGEEEANRISRESLERGSKLHKSIEDWVNTGELSDNPLFQVAYDSVLSESTPICVETQVHSPFGYAGTLDYLGEYRGLVTVVDWKTASKPKKDAYVLDYKTQIAAYAKAVERTYPGIKVQQGLVCVLIEGFPEPQLFLMDEKVIEKHWQRFLKRFKKYVDLISEDE